MTAVDLIDTISIVVVRDINSVAMDTSSIVVDTRSTVMLEAIAKNTISFGYFIHPGTN